jgi:hypothetical protein
MSKVIAGSENIMKNEKRRHIYVAGCQRASLEEKKEISVFDVPVYIYRAISRYGGTHFQF